MWIYSSGFPKSQDVGKSIERNENNDGSQWAGWGTQLKPAHEPICMARKPIKTSIAKNVQKYGTGALNIDASRIERDDKTSRFPSNVIGEIPDYQKFFYCPKVSRKERHIGHEMPPPMFGDKQGAYDDNGRRYAVELDKREGNVGNNHPTVKPIKLMEYLIKLVTPPNGTVLDPFNGSGSTGCAAVKNGFNYVGIELDSNYVDISNKRIQSILEPKTDNKFKDLFDD